ncbi:MAG: polyprenyl synthetase family protein [Candidatus Moranbacteria bacterium]|nr:polyprenyl synthetase family protein [Candidatus Moranbacteria bacterium]
MDFKQTLSEFKGAIDKELSRFFDAMIAVADKEDRLLADALRQTKKIALGGGKRIRGALVQCAYFGVGGKEKKKILKVACAIELLHLFFLIHDDVIDRGDLRHKEKTINKFFFKKATQESEHFGNCMAIIVGDMLFAKANEIILEAGFEKRETMAALKNLQRVVQTTVIGQTQDISIHARRKISESEVIRMYENKTAQYTFQGPLQLGAMLAGKGDKKTLEILGKYAIALGIAFQLQDDVLGIFGEEDKTGKSSVSDIQEGKQSLMVIYAKTKAGAGDRKSLEAISGKRKLTSSEVKKFKDILLGTGAKKYACELADEYLAKGEKEIEKVALLPKSKSFLLDLAKYLREREL